jgi:hypothetical protein
MNSNLIELVKENPDLPIFAWVWWEVVQDDCYSWLGQFGKAEVREYAVVEPFGYHDQTMVFKDDTEEYHNYLADNDKYIDMTEEEYEKAFEEVINNLQFKKAIFVYVGLPDNL